MRPTRNYADPSPGDQLGREDGNLRAAIRFALVVSLAGFAFLVIAALWVSTCGAAADIDTVACGRPQRTLLGLGAPVILLVGGVWAFARTYRIWRDEGTWWGWQGAGWFLMTLMMVSLTMGFPPISGMA
ncbi:MAG: hypothetical protein HYZ38_06505 [Mycobacterium sp.]|nr:hypothetical protein [Mycobacterium sp.]